MILFSNEDVLYSDVEKCLTLPVGKKFVIANSLKEINKLLRDARECQIVRDGADRITGVIPPNVPFYGLRDAINILKKRIKPTKKKKYIRNLEEYCFFDPYMFSGVIINKPAHFFDDVIYVAGNDRVSQTLVKYPEHILNHIKVGAAFYYLGSTFKGEEFSFKDGEEDYFSDLLMITDRTTGTSHYFGVWK